MTNDAPIPQAIEAEQALLGVLLQSPDAIDRVGDLRAEAFFREDHRTIYRTVTRLIERRKPSDVVSVLSELGEEAESVGGLAYLGDLAMAVKSESSVARYAEIVRDKALTRELMAMAGDLHALALAPGRSGLEKLDEAQGRVMALADTAAFAASEPVPIERALGEFVDKVQARYDADDTAGISTGFPDIDRRIPGGLDEGWFAVIAARPGMGKTSLALQIGHAFADKGHPVLVLSQEMPNVQLAERVVSFESLIPIETLRTGKLNDDEWMRMTHAIGKLGTCDFPMYLDEQPALRIEDVNRKCRQVKRKRGLRLVVIDYLQLMVGEGENRVRELTAITAALKALAKELKCTILALSQLNRSLESRPNKRPIMSDLRESGSIEQDADIILSIYRDEVYDPGSRYAGLAEIGFMKHRSGKPGGFVGLTFRGECAKFESRLGDWPAEVEQDEKPRRRGFAG